MLMAPLIGIRSGLWQKGMRRHTKSTRDLCPGDKDDNHPNMIVLATAKGWQLHQMDVKNVFLQGKLEEEVYMVQPPRFESSMHPIVVCRLKKPLYGLKQAPRAWHSNITQYLHQNGLSIISKSFSPADSK